MPATSQQSTATVFAGIQLDMPCSDCTGPEAEAALAKNRREWSVWTGKEEAAFKVFMAEYDRQHPTGSVYDPTKEWHNSDTYRELLMDIPDENPEWCPTCSGVRRVLTDAGQTLVAFVDSWRGAR